MKQLEISERRKWDGQEILARFGFPTDIPSESIFKMDSGVGARATGLPS